MNKPFSPSSERNREPILKVLKEVFGSQARALLEIGSGTGQHAVYFASALPQLRWTTSDVTAHHDGIRLWLDEAQLPNVSGPIALEVGANEFLANEFDAAFSANVLHIMDWEKGKILFAMLGRLLAPRSDVVFYGPFNYQGSFTSQSNREFDRWLKVQYGETSGIRHFEDVCREMKIAGFDLKRDYEMPSNNRVLHFERTA